MDLMSSCFLEMGWSWEKPLLVPTMPQGRWKQRRGFEEFYGKSSAGPGSAAVSTEVRHHPQELLAQKHQKSASSSFHMGHLIPNNTSIFLSIFYERSQPGFLLPTKLCRLKAASPHPKPGVWTAEGGENRSFLWDLILSWSPELCRRRSGFSPA